MNLKAAIIATFAVLAIAGTAHADSNLPWIFQTYDSNGAFLGGSYMDGYSNNRASACGARDIANNAECFRASRPPSQGTRFSVKGIPAEIYYGPNYARVCEGMAKFYRQAGDSAACRPYTMR